MLTLIDTVIGFAVVMLLLSFLIKSLTSVVKNHVQYYSQNFRRELERVLLPLPGMTLKKLESALGGIDWRNVGGELLDPNNLKPILQKINSRLDLSDLAARLAVHKSALDFAFEKRMKNLTLACGTALCLLLNVNAFTIWQTLYENGELRTKFSSDEYVAKVLEQAEGQEENGEEMEPPATPAAAAGSLDPPATPEPPAANPSPSAETDHAALGRDRAAWAAELDRFRSEVDFGVGAIWTQPKPTLLEFLYQFIGSLLTGLLASIGAPYLHDLLRTVTSFRKP